MDDLPIRSFSRQWPWVDLSPGNGTRTGPQDCDPVLWACRVDPGDKERVQGRVRWSRGSRSRSSPILPWSLVQYYAPSRADPNIRVWAIQRWTQENLQAGCEGPTRDQGQNHRALNPFSFFPSTKWTQDHSPCYFRRCQERTSLQCVLIKGLKIAQGATPGAEGNTKYALLSMRRGGPWREGGPGVDQRRVGPGVGQRREGPGADPGCCMDLALRM